MRKSMVVTIFIVLAMLTVGAGVVCAEPSNGERPQIQYYRGPQGMTPQDARVHGPQYGPYPGPRPFDYRPDMRPRPYDYRPPIGPRPFDHRPIVRPRPFDDRPPIGPRPYDHRPIVRPRPYDYRPPIGPRPFMHRPPYGPRPRRPGWYGPVPYTENNYYYRSNPVEDVMVYLMYKVIDRMDCAE